MVQGVGYALGSSGTLFVYLLHSATGSFAPAGILFLVVGILACVFGSLAGRARHVGDAPKK
jgi:CP family cyanate transporter-like MFS transporter